ncbi:ABC transporter substrate-binding protein [Bradyrhizobium sp. ARR65]|uniref:heme/hemin ABC transporter substrate-binding protein n=1 Tax=Bradyrhizobium sp. ARR65 TaxID=1040989 RepID=UPI0004654020|nr:ABC transporter substrate-binding protein [Bradyrhizobium sp. ARR65]
MSGFREYSRWAASAATVLVLLGFTFVARAADADRIVALGGAVTEILYALGQQGKIVGVDATSLYPPQALKDKPSVGYFRSVSAEGILSERPTRVLMVEGSGPAAALQAVAQAGIPINRVPDAPTAEGVIAKIIAVGEAAGVSEEARQLASQVKARFAELARFREKIDASRRVLFVIALQNGRPLVGGRGTAGDAIVTLAGGANVAEFDGYKPMADEAIVNAAPDAILMMDRPGGPTGEDVLSLPAFALTPAGKARALIVMDGLYLLGFGPRTPDAARDLMQALYPNLNLPRLTAKESGGR